jgi:hypothetical protein
MAAEAISAIVAGKPQCFGRFAEGFRLASDKFRQ